MKKMIEILMAWYRACKLQNSCELCGDAKACKALIQFLVLTENLSE